MENLYNTQKIEKRYIVIEEHLVKDGRLFWLSLAPTVGGWSGLGSYRLLGEAEENALKFSEKYKCDDIIIMNPENREKMLKKYF